MPPEAPRRAQEPRTVPKRTNVPSTVPESDIAALVRVSFADAPIMVRVAEAESRFDPYAKNPGSTAKGLFQILDGTWRSYGCQGSPYNPSANIECAHKLYQAEGLRPWTASRGMWSS